MTRRPRAIALLLVLVLLVTGATAATIAARIGVTHALARDTRLHARLADDLRAACDGPILAWLQTEADGTVLPPDVRQPRVAVLDDALVLAGVPARVRITAWDQAGMVPASASAALGLLVATLPPDARRARDALRGAAPGLDALTAARFPHPDDDRPAVGALLATHNPVPATNPRQRTGAVTINVNTAPLDLVAAVFANAGLSGVERIRDARAAGDPAGLQSLSLGDQDATVLLAGRSPAWAVRVDATVGRATSSSWLILARTGSEWEVLQRLVVDR